MRALLSFDTQTQCADTLPPLYSKLCDLMLTTQYASESRHALEVVSKTSIPPFPQTALTKLRALIQLFPAYNLTSSQLARLLLTLHPILVYSTFQAWDILGRQAEQAGLGELGSPSIISSDECTGLLGYRISSIDRVSETTARLTFDGPSCVQIVVPAGPLCFQPFPLTRGPDLQFTPRFIGLLTCFMQAHALGWDISLVPPAALSSASTSTSTLVKVFGDLLGYDTEVLHMYKELGGRELYMRRRIENGGATTWEPRYDYPFELTFCLVLKHYIMVVL